MAASRRPRNAASAAPSAPAEAPDTRSRVLELAWNLIATRGDAAISLVDLAREAGLSRQTLYLLFGSRAGLLLAMVEHMDLRSNAGARLAAARQAAGAPEQAFEAYVRTWLDYLPRVLPVARALAAAATAGDAEARAAIDSRMAMLRAGFLQLTRALHQAGRLRAGWTPAAAADWLFATTHADTWQHLVVEAGWKPREATDRVVAALRETLLVRG